MCRGTGVGGFIPLTVSELALGLSGHRYHLVVLKFLQGTIVVESSHLYVHCNIIMFGTTH
jgi:hypothetical protein